MKRRLMALALGLTLAASTLPAASPAAAQVPGMVLYGCVAVQPDGSLLVSTGGAGRGMQGDGNSGHDTRSVQVPPGFDTSTINNGCGLVVVYEQDGVWYAQTVQVTGDGEGNLTYETTQITRDGQGGPTVERNSGQLQLPERPVRPFRGNR